MSCVVAGRTRSPRINFTLCTFEKTTRTYIKGNLISTIDVLCGRGPDSITADQFHLMSVREDREDFACRRVEQANSLSLDLRTFVDFFSVAALILATVPALIVLNPTDSLLLPALIQLPNMAMRLSQLELNSSMWFMRSALAPLFDSCQKRGVPSLAEFEAALPQYASLLAPPAVSGNLQATFILSTDGNVTNNEFPPRIDYFVLVDGSVVSLCTGEDVVAGQCRQYRVNTPWALAEIPRVNISAMFGTALVQDGLARLAQKPEPFVSLAALPDENSGEPRFVAWVPLVDNSTGALLGGAATQMRISRSRWGSLFAWRQAFGAPIQIWVFSDGLFVANFTSLPTEYVSVVGSLLAPTIAKRPPPVSLTRFGSLTDPTLGTYDLAVARFPLDDRGTLTLDMVFGTSCTLFDGWKAIIFPVMAAMISVAIFAILMQLYCVWQITKPIVQLADRVEESLAALLKPDVLVEACTVPQLDPLKAGGETPGSDSDPLGASHLVEVNRTLLVLRQIVLRQNVMRAVGDAICFPMLLIRPPPGGEGLSFMHWQITYANVCFLTTFGYRQGEVPQLKRLLGSRAKRVRLSSGGGTEEGGGERHRTHFADGDKILLHTVANEPVHVLLRIVELAPTVRILVLEDISRLVAESTERLHLERQILLVQRIQCLGRLARGFSVELNNCLGGMVSSLELARNELLPGMMPPATATLECIDPEAPASTETPTTPSSASMQEPGQLISDILRMVGRVSQTVSQLALFSQSAPRAHTVVDGHQCIVEACADLGSARPGVRLVTALGATEFIVQYDAALFRNAIGNLIVNGCDAMAPATGTVSITTCNEFDPTWGTMLVIAVTDQGRGIAQANLPRIFEPFFTTKQRGTGLGLPVVFGMVQDLGGRIEVWTGHWGTRFALRLPLRASSGENLATMSESRPRASVAYHHTEAPPASLRACDSMASDEGSDSHRTPVSGRVGSSASFSSHLSSPGLRPSLSACSSLSSMGGACEAHKSRGGANPLVLRPGGIPPPLTEMDQEPEDVLLVTARPEEDGAEVEPLVQPLGCRLCAVGDDAAALEAIGRFENHWSAILVDAEAPLPRTATLEAFLAALQAASPTSRLAVVLPSPQRLFKVDAPDVCLLRKPYTVEKLAPCMGGTAPPPTHPLSPPFSPSPAQLPTQPAASSESPLTEFWLASPPTTATPRHPIPPDPPAGQQQHHHPPAAKPRCALHLRSSLLLVALAFTASLFLFNVFFFTGSGIAVQTRFNEILYSFLPATLSAAIASELQGPLRSVNALVPLLTGVNATRLEDPLLYQHIQSNLFDPTAEVSVSVADEGSGSDKLYFYTKTGLVLCNQSSPAAARLDCWAREMGDPFAVGPFVPTDPRTHWRPDLASPECVFADPRSCPPWDPFCALWRLQCASPLRLASPTRPAVVGMSVAFNLSMYLQPKDSPIGDRAVRYVLFDSHLRAVGMARPDAVLLDNIRDVLMAGPGPVPDDGTTFEAEDSTGDAHTVAPYPLSVSGMNMTVVVALPRSLNMASMATVAVVLFVGAFCVGCLLFIILAVILTYGTRGFTALPQHVRETLDDQILALGRLGQAPTAAPQKTRPTSIFGEVDAIYATLCRLRENPYLLRSIIEVLPMPAVLCHLREDIDGPAAWYEALCHPAPNQRRPAYEVSMVNSTFARVVGYTADRVPPLHQLYTHEPQQAGSPDVSEDIIAHGEDHHHPLPGFEADRVGGGAGSSPRSSSSHHDSACAWQHGRSHRHGRGRGCMHDHPRGTLGRADGGALPVAVHMLHPERGILIAIFEDLSPVVAEHEACVALSQQLHELQQAESTGRFAGGAAHDINNVLTGIILNTELLQGRLHATGGHPPLPASHCTAHGEANLDAALPAIGDVLALAHRASETVAKLLMFSRRAPRSGTGVADAHQCVGPSRTCCATRSTRASSSTPPCWPPSTPSSAIVGRADAHCDVPTTSASASRRWSCRTYDQTLLRNSLLNLAVNARDAMPNGGELLFATANATLPLPATATATVTATVTVTVTVTGAAAADTTAAAATSASTSAATMMRTRARGSGFGRLLAPPAQSQQQQQPRQQQQQQLQRQELQQPQDQTQKQQHSVLLAGDVPLPAGAAPGRYLVLAVSDTGTGIAPAAQPHLFEPFTTKTSAAGLGLAAVFGMLQDVGGWVDVTTGPWGSRFALWLPLPGTRPAGPATTATTTATAAPVGAAGLGPAGGGAATTGLVPVDRRSIRFPFRVLLVDDDRVIQLAGAQILRSLGAEAVVVVGDGQAALEAVAAAQRPEERPFDLVLLDLGLPLMAGPEAFARMREVAPDLVVVVLSGDAAGPEGDALLAAGAAATLQKPFGSATLGEVLALVAPLVAARRRRSHRHASSSSSLQSQQQQHARWVASSVPAPAAPADDHVMAIPALPGTTTAPPSVVPVSNPAGLVAPPDLLLLLPVAESAAEGPPGVAALPSPAAPVRAAAGSGGGDQAIPLWASSQRLVSPTDQPPSTLAAPPQEDGAAGGALLPPTRRTVPRMRSRVAPPQPVLPDSPCILLVDDDEVVRKVAAKMLHHLGYRVLQARDGLEGVEQFQAHMEDVALVMLDIVMPRMGGREAFFEMKRLCPAVRVLIASGFPEGADVEELTRAGARFLQKPYPLKVLRATLELLLAPPPPPPFIMPKKAAEKPAAKPAEEATATATESEAPAEKREKRTRRMKSEATPAVGHHKRKQTAYQLYVQTNLEQIKKDHPDMKGKEALTLLREQWRSAPENPKAEKKEK
ncbi:putative response regulator [Paratrimastix pyriformis]|uniref:Response regulator n=1 Tax=Paratrimastix pyriformis TaxID=342808 RepID=A0ABQ8UH70_9EUKA|nr:putative response regulator [Paratrimastix pyriformis]